METILNPLTPEQKVMIHDALLVRDPQVHFHAWVQRQRRPLLPALKFFRRCYPEYDNVTDDQFILAVKELY